MLKQRVITAIVLLAILLPALFYQTPEPFCAVALVLICGRGLGVGSPQRLRAGRFDGAWRWSAWRLARCPGTAACWKSSCPCSGRLPSAAWVLAGGWLLRNGVAGWPRIPKALRLVAGWSRCGWPGWRWRRRASPASTSCCPCCCWSGWRISLPTSPAAPSAASSAKASWRLRSARARAGKVSGAAWPAWSCSRWPGLCGRLPAAPGSGVRQRSTAGWRRTTAWWLLLIGGRLPGGHERGGRPGRVADQAQRRAPRTPAACCPATAACSTASTRCCPRCRWR